MRRDVTGVDFAVSLIMAAIAFRMCNLRFGGVDLMPDLFGMLLLLIALLILQKKDYEFRGGFFPWVFAFLLSGWNLYNFMPGDPSALFGVLYVIAEGLLLLAECRVYRKLFAGFESFYDREDPAARRSVFFYGASKACGIALNIAMWTMADRELAWLTLTYSAWVLLHLVVATWLMYRFYLLKPKFRPRKTPKKG